MTKLSMPANGTATLDSNDAWNRCLRERYHARTEVVEKLNLVSGQDAFTKNLANASDDWQASKDRKPRGKCYN
jgi:hypothetical protein